MPRLSFNARTGEMSGVTSLKIGDPPQDVTTYITQYISTHQEEVYDSDLVVSTILKNINPAYIAPGAVSFDSDQIVAIINENSSPAVGGGLDSETIMNMANEHGWNYLDSDAVLAAVLKNLNIANVATLTDINDINNNIITINNKIDSESTKVSSLKTRVYGLVKNNDSDHNRRISLIESRYVRLSLFDSERARTQRLYRYVLGNDLGQPPTNGSTLWQNIYDSDVVLTTISKGYSPSAAAYDSDLVVGTLNKNLDIASLSRIPSNPLDSDEVFNMGTEHGWFYDSDKVVDTISKNFQYIINITNNNLGKVDSDFVFTMLDSEEVLNMFTEHGLAYKSALDSESAEIRILRADVNALVAGTYNDAPILARLTDLEQSLDSESARINLALSNADSDVVNIAILRRDADSDSIAIQAIKAQADIDSAYITLIRNDLDSDGNKLQSLDTRVKAVEATNTIQVSQINIINAKLDSDEARLESIDQRIDILELINYLDSDNIISIINDNTVGLTDSDLKAIGDLRNDVDSDSIRIQDLQTQINNLVDDAGFDSDQVVAIINENVNPYDDSIILARLDSDSVKLQQLQSDVDILDLEIIGLNASLNARLDSDSIRIQNLQTEIENIDVADIRARLDSDSIVIQNIRTAVDSDFDLFNTKIALFNGLTDSDLTTVSNLRNDVDSDSIRIQDLQTQINNLIDDTGFDSDQIVAIIGENVTPFDDTNIIARLDSDETIIQSLQTQIDALNASAYDDSALVARLDSDSIVIQDLQTQINNIDVADLRSRLDSDSIAIQAIRTSVDSDFDLFNTKIALFNGLTDSDLTTVSILRNDLDSESIEIRALRIDVDSDSSRIQTLAGQVASLEAGTYDDSALVARLDSDSAVLQELRSDLDDSEFVIERTPLRLNNASFATTSSNQVLDTYDAGEHKTVKYIISAKKGTDWQSSECLVNHDGTTAYITEYSVMDSGAGDLYIPDVDVSGGAVRLLVTPQTTNINVSIIRTQIN